MNLKKIYAAGVPVYGNVGFRGKCPKESVEQISFFNHIRTHYPEYAEVAFHVRNEGKASARQRVNQQLEGMKTGASDVVIAMSPPFVCELKRQDHTESSISDDQIDFLKNTRKLGGTGVIALGCHAAVIAFEDHLDAINKTK